MNNRVLRFALILSGLCAAFSTTYAQLPHSWLATDLRYHDGITQILAADLHFEAALHKVGGVIVGEILDETSDGCATWEDAGKTGAQVEVSQFGHSVEHPEWMWNDGDTLYVWFYGYNPPGGGIDSVLIVDVQTVLNSEGLPNNPQWYPGPGDAGTIPVPVELMAFSAQRQGSDVVLSWTVARELENLGFYVQRSGSADGAFARISELIPGRGTANQEAAYSWTDAVPQGPVAFYMLEDVDFQGRSTFHGPVRVVAGGSTTWGAIKAAFAD